VEAENSFHEVGAIVEVRLGHVTAVD
jgi:hypothetical protein